jgi:hypothetical protein
MVQRFDIAGAALSQPEVVYSRMDTTPEQTNIAASSGRALVNWRVPYYLGDEYLHAIVPAAGTAATGTLVSRARALGSDAGRPVPRITSSLAVLTWYRPLDQQMTTEPQSPLRGVSIDTGAVVRRSGTGSVDDEVLPVPLHDSFSAGVASDGSALLVATSGAAVLGTAEVSASAFIELRTLSPGNSPLAIAPPVVRRSRNISPLDPFGATGSNVQHIVPLPDRLLLLGHDGIALTVAVAHRN